MSYKLRYTELSTEQMNKVLEMSIGNSDEQTNNERWVVKAKQRIDTDLELAEQALEVFLGRDDK